MWRQTYKPRSSCCVILGFIEEKLVNSFIFFLVKVPSMRINAAPRPSMTPWWSKAAEWDTSPAKQYHSGSVVQVFRFLYLYKLGIFDTTFIQTSTSTRTHLSAHRYWYQVPIPQLLLIRNMSVNTRTDNSEEWSFFYFWKKAAQWLCNRELKILDFSP